VLTGSAFELELRLCKRDGRSAAPGPLQPAGATITGQSSVGMSPVTDIDDGKRAEEPMQQENVALREKSNQTRCSKRLSALARADAVLSHVSKVAGSDSTVLITGETAPAKNSSRGRFTGDLDGLQRVRGRELCGDPRDLDCLGALWSRKRPFTGALQRRLVGSSWRTADDLPRRGGEPRPPRWRCCGSSRNVNSSESGQHPIRVDVRVIGPATA